MIARASAAESASVIELAEALRLIGASDSAFLQDQLLQVYKMLCKLK